MNLDLQNKNLIPKEKKKKYTVHSRFRDSVDCWAPSMEYRFQVAKFSFEVQKSSSLFCLVQNNPGVTWVACIGLRERLSGP